MAALRTQFRWERMRDLLRYAVRRLDEESLPQVAGSLTFTTVLALVPMLTIALAIFTTFPMFTTLRTALEAYFVQSLMPKAIANTILGNLSLFAAKASRLSAFGAAALVVTVVAMLGMIDRAFNHIWRVQTRRPITQRILVYWAIVTLGPLLIGFSMTITSFLFTATTGVVSKVPFVGVVFYTLVSIALTMIAFALSYMALPNRTVEWRDAAWGGLVAALAFEIAKRSFAMFVTHFSSYTVVYGALAALPLFLVWIYVSWLVTLVGAVITASLPILRYERWWHVSTPVSTFIDAMTILEMLHAARHSAGSAAVEGSLIRAQTRIGVAESEALLEKMREAGWVARIKPTVSRRVQWGKRISEGLDAWSLLVNPTQLRVADVYRLFVFNSSANPALARQVEAAIEQGLANSLATQFASPETTPARSASASTSPSRP